MSFTDTDEVSSWMRHTSATYITVPCLPPEHSPKTCAIIYDSQSNGIHALVVSLKNKKREKKRKICDFSLVISKRFASVG